VHRYGVLDPHPVVRSGLPTTGLARTVIDVCRTVAPAAALATVDAAMRDYGLDPAGVCAVLETLGDVNFRQRTRDVLSWGDPAAENAFESFSRGQLLLEGLPAPILQWWVGDGAATWFRPDKLWPGLGLIGEADGRGKYRRETNPWSGEDRDPLAREKDRQEWFADRDFEVLRYTPPRIGHHADEVAARWRVLADRQRRRGWRWPRGVWLVAPGPWPPGRAVIRDESARWSTLSPTAHAA
jgi:hypothetical protein